MRQTYDFWSLFPKENTHFLKKQYEEYKIKKPFKGVNILSNIHLTKASICKLAPLMVSGANLKVTASEALHKDEKVITFFSEKDLYVCPEKIQEYQYDIVLDCGASLFKQITPKVGFVELTKSAILENLKNKATKYVDIDKTELKEIENLYGTGDGFVRALKSQSLDIKNKSFLVFGYGKVGQGIVRALQPYTNKICVVEIEEEKIKKAQFKGLEVINVSEYGQIKKKLKDIFLVVTATGEKGFISDYFDKDAFEGIYKANMGTYDEWGKDFKTEEILGNKKPLNFTLEEPTSMKFLDPVFYAHNAAIETLLNEQTLAGKINFPAEEDKKIIQEWAKIHHFRF